MKKQVLIMFIVLSMFVYLSSANAGHFKPHACEEITSQNLKMKNLQITSSAMVTDVQYGSYCKVLGKVNERTGIDGKTYAISFELRLPVPESWNKRFMYQGNGGNDGAVVPATGGSNDTGGNNALKRGFAVISTDAGHNGADPANAGYGLAAGNAFGLDPQARYDYGYAATGTMAPIAKDIIAYYYGKKPVYSYMIGCSNGGRHGMVAATRYPYYFDGILAGSPGFNLPKAAVQHAWDVQSFQIANADFRQAFSTDDMKLVGKAVSDVCDELDGVKDGMVADLKGCEKVFDLSILQCPGTKNSSCLTSEQITALERSMGGPRNSANKQLYSKWPFDPGIANRDWRLWKLASGVPPWDSYPLIAIMGGGSLSYIFTTPPTVTPGTPADLVDYLSYFNFDTDAPKIYARNRTFRQSAMDFMTPVDVDNPKMKDFRKAGGKLLIYHGQSDGVFSVNDTIRWYEKLQANYRGRADHFVRLFLVPGMGHCSGSCATDQFDALTALMNWVEKGKAPDQLLAQVNSANDELPVDWSKTRTRPLCVWPEIPVYINGDIDSANSFRCHRQ
jgi:pimeloyl-ACP methyl ester carboxylesterase